MPNIIKYNIKNMGTNIYSRPLNIPVVVGSKFHIQDLVKSKYVINIPTDIQDISAYT